MIQALGPKRGGPDEIKLHKLPNGDTPGDFIPAESGWRVMGAAGLMAVRQTGRLVLLVAKALCNIDRWRCWVEWSFCRRHRRGVDYFPLRAGLFPRFVYLQDLPHV